MYRNMIESFLQPKTLSCKSIDITINLVNGDIYSFKEIRSIKYEMFHKNK